MTLNNEGPRSTELRDHAIRHLAGRQFGVIGLNQALHLGLTVKAIAYRVRSGDWRRVLPRVYVLSAVPPSWEQRLKAAELWAGEETAVSHRSAGLIWGMDGLEPGTIELITTRGTRRVPGGIILHRTTVLARRDWAEFVGFRVTGMARTLVDLAGVVDHEAFETAAESAFMKNGHRYDELVVRLDELGAQGRNGVTAVREFLANRDPNSAATESRLETRFLHLIRAAGLPEPTRQYVVSDGERFVTRLDFAYVPIRFGIRPNGKGTHLLPGQWQKTRPRAMTLRSWRGPSSISPGRTWPSARSR